MTTRHFEAAAKKCRGSSVLPDPRCCGDEPFCTKNLPPQIQQTPQGRGTRQPRLQDLPPAEHLLGPRRPSVRRTVTILTTGSPAQGRKTQRSPPLINYDELHNNTS